MPGRATVEAFVAMVEASRFDDALEAFYVDDASMQENNDAPRVGLAGLVAGERRVMAANKRITARHAGPIFIDGDQVAIRWMFEFTNAEGKTRTLDEIAWQRWRGDKVAEERFFYDPKQLGR